MNKNEFEEKIKTLNIKRVKNKSLIKSFLERNREYYINKNELNIYGMYNKDNEFIIFFKDIERAVITELGRFKTEDEAFDSLYSTMISWENKIEASNVAN